MSDPELAKVYRRFERELRRDSSYLVDDRALDDLLAAVGDHRSLKPKEILKAIKNEPMDDKTLLDWIRYGLNSREVADVQRILDSNDSVPLTPRARRLLEVLINRRDVDDNDGNGEVDGLNVVKTLKTTMRGKAKPGSTIEAINLSTAPLNRLDVIDAMVIGKADQNGKFSAKYTGHLQGAKEGDIVRMRARTPDGKFTHWLTVKIDAGGRDKRNAVVHLDRCLLTFNGRGKFAFTNISSRPLSEPYARLRLTNQRTGKFVTIILDHNGQPPPESMLPGKRGDYFKVAVSDGANNKRFTKSAGGLQTAGAGRAEPSPDFKDPALCKYELDSRGRPMFELKRFNGPLFVNGVSPDDVEQGYIANCFFPAAVAAIAARNPKAIERMIKKNRDGTYEVTFKKWNERTYAYNDVTVKVDGDLWVRPSGAPIYGTSANTQRDPKKMEMWFPIIEKAYAIFTTGSYKKMGDGGSAADVFDHFLGKWSTWYEIHDSSPNKVWRDIQKVVRHKAPAVFATRGDRYERDYHGSGLYSDHTYSLLGCRTASDGTRWVKLRNPWASCVPGGDPRAKGVFEMKTEDVCKYFSFFDSLDL